MKRVLALILIALMLLPCLPALAKSKKMDTELPEWTEETVRQYVLDYVGGEDYDRLYSYFDLQIRRYMPDLNFQTMLTTLEWMTGKFVGLGTYSSFEDAEMQMKTHVIHLCMEKQDLDLYFTTKNEEDDWEVMALEFVPAEHQDPIEMIESENDD